MPSAKLTTCAALQADERTRCSKTPTHGKHCSVHHVQYKTLTRAYKDASKQGDLMEKTPFPTEMQIQAMCKLGDVRAEAKRVRDHLELIRVEKKGRELHHKRFFLKVDDGHKIRLKVLEKRMKTSLTLLDSLDAKEYDLTHANELSHIAWVKSFQSRSLASVSSAEPTVPYPHSLSWFLEEECPTVTVSVDETEEDDPIQVSLKAEKRRWLRRVRWLIEDREDFLDRSLEGEDRNNKNLIRELDVLRDTRIQFWRRIVLHDPVLAQRAQDKVSYLDMFHSSDFHSDDFERLRKTINMMGDALLWWKDATLEALAMHPAHGKQGDVANIGLREHRVKLLGGWVYKVPHEKAMKGEGWWNLFKAARIPKNIENRMMRLFYNFDEMHLYFMLAGMAVPSPDRVSSIKAARIYLSICGYILDEMVPGIPMIQGPFPALNLPVTVPGMTAWAELQKRAYLFGVVRDERDDFNDEFLRQLASRPDLFVVITHSDSDPDEKVNKFGGPSDETHFCVRFRHFEARSNCLSSRPASSGTWKVLHSSHDILYGSGAPVSIIPGLELPTISGYIKKITSSDRATREGWLFTHKRFPTKYVVILDAKTDTDGQDLTAMVVWAALRAHRLVDGWVISPYFLGIAVATLFQKQLSNIFAGGWMPKHIADHVIGKDMFDFASRGSTHSSTLAILDDIALSELTRYEDEIALLRHDKNALMGELVIDLNSHPFPMLVVGGTLQNDPTPQNISLIVTFYDRAFRSRVFRLYHFASVWVHVRDDLQALRLLGYTDSTASSDLVENIKIRTIWFKMRQTLFREVVWDLALEIKYKLASIPHFIEYFTLEKESNSNAAEPRVTLDKQSTAHSTFDSYLLAMIDPESFWDAPFRLSMIQEAMDSGTSDGQLVDQRLSDLLTEYATLVHFMDISGRPMHVEETKSFFNNKPSCDEKLWPSAPECWDEGEAWGGKPLIATSFKKFLFELWLNTNDSALTSLWDQVDQSYSRFASKSIREYFEMPPVTERSKWSSGELQSGSKHEAGKGHKAQPDCLSTQSKKKKKKTHAVSASSKVSSTSEPGQKHPTFTVPGHIAETFNAVIAVDDGPGVARGELQWSEFVEAMRHVGFSVVPGQGSAVIFKPPSVSDAPITLYKSRPTSVLSKDRLGRIGWRLRRAYGWDSSWFHTAAPS